MYSVVGWWVGGWVAGRVKMQVLRWGLVDGRVGGMGEGRQRREDCASGGVGRVDDRGDRAARRLQWPGALAGAAWTSNDAWRTHRASQQPAALL